MRDGVLARICLVLALASGLSGCANVLRARGTVLNPMYRFADGDTDTPRPPRILVIHRRENRVTVKNTIIGPYGKPMALDILGEYASIPEQRTDGGGLYIETLIFSNYKDELSEKGLEQYEFWLELPDGRKIKGEVHVQHGLQDHSVKITGAHMEKYMTIRDRSTGTAQNYYAVQEVENDFELYSRWGRIRFVADHMIDARTPYVIFVVKGFQRERRYRFDFTNDPNEAMQSFIELTN